MKVNLHSIASKLIFGGVLAVLIPLTIVGFFSFSKSHHALSDMSKTQVYGIATDLARMTHSILRVEMDRARSLAVQQAVVDAAESVQTSGIDASKKLADRAFQSLKRQFSVMGKQYQGIFVADTSGMIYTGVLSGGGVYKAIDLSKNPAFAKVKSTGDTVISEMIVSKATGKPATAAFAPVKSADGEFLGVLGTVIKADYFTSLIANRKIGKTGYGYMIDSKGLVLAHPKTELVLKLNGSSIKEMATLNRRMQSGESGVEEYVFKGVPKIAGFAPVGRQRLVHRRDPEPG